MTLSEEFRSRNFSIYAQWTGVLCIILCLAVGISTIFSFSAVLIVFSCLCIASAIIILFIELRWLLRICPTSAKFDGFIRRFNSNWMRAAIYLLLSVIQWISLVKSASSLIAAAVVLLITSIFYALAALKDPEVTSSKMLGGQGVAQMIV